MRTIAVVARKGGSGKTTVAVHLAVASHLAGHRTVIADSDPQGSAVHVFSRRQCLGPDCVAATAAGILHAQVRARMAGVEALIIDTPAGSEEGMSNAVVLADLSVLVVRPTFLDIAAAAQTASVLKRIGRPTVLVLNQAPVPRAGIEAPTVKQALEALELLRLPIAPAILRSRAGYQTALGNGRTAMEVAPGGPIDSEVRHLWRFLAAA